MNDIRTVSASKMHKQKLVGHAQQDNWKMLAIVPAKALNRLTFKHHTNVLNIVFLFSFRTLSAVSAPPSPRRCGTAASTVTASTSASTPSSCPSGSSTAAATAAATAATVVPRARAAAWTRRFRPLRLSFWRQR